MLARTLQDDPKAEQIANETEQAIYEKHQQQTNHAYKTDISSRLWNLKNVSNPTLKQQLLTGQITPQQFANMSDEDMSSPEEKSKRQSIRNQTIKDSIGIDQMIPMIQPDVENPSEHIPASDET
jgi:hypothetical protein